MQILCFLCSYTHADVEVSSWIILLFIFFISCWQDSEKKTGKLTLAQCGVSHTLTWNPKKEIDFQTQMRSQAITLTKLVLTSTLKEVIQVERTDFIWGMTRLPMSSQTDCYFLSLNNTSYCLKRSLTGMWLSCTGKWHPPLVLQTRNMNHISHQTDLIFMLFVELISKWMRTLKKRDFSQWLMENLFTP